MSLGRQSAGEGGGAVDTAGGWQESKRAVANTYLTERSVVRHLIQRFQPGCATPAVIGESKSRW